MSIECPIKTRENIKGERRERLPVQGGEVSDFAGVLSRLSRNEEMFVFLKWLHQGSIQAYW